MWKFPYSFCILAIFYFINWIVAAEIIEGGNCSREETICGNTDNINTVKCLQITVVILHTIYTYAVKGRFKSLF